MDAYHYIFMCTWYTLGLKLSCVPISKLCVHTQYTSSPALMPYVNNKDADDQPIRCHDSGIPRHVLAKTKISRLANLCS